MPVADYNGRGKDEREGMVTEDGKVDPSDPRVKKLVYSMYRDMLTNYSDNATHFINQKHPSQVTQDLGIGPILQSLISQGASESGASTNNTPSSNSTGSMPPPPPPPPMVHHGHIPAVRLNTEIGPRDKGPPMALAGAMMKDKKPFTYTPGGIDLSEIRSPRMAKRLQMNAAAEGVTSAPESRAAQGGTNSAPAHQISPTTYAAMQPQMAIPVFPQGGFNSNQLNRAPKPSDFTDNVNNSPRSSNGVVPPPPPPQFMMQQQQQHHQPNISAARSPPPPPERGSVPMSHHQHQVGVAAQQSDSRPGSNVSNRSFEEDMRISSPVGRSSPASNNTGTGIIYIPPVPPTQQPPPPPQSPPPPRVESPVVRQTKAQAASQHLGSIYIPPIENRPSVFSPATASTATPSTAGGGSGSPQSIKSPLPSAAALSTPQLNKAPTPWMNSYNRMATKQVESPPYVNAANTPWGTMSAPPQGQQGQSVVRTIPISIARDDNGSSSTAYPSNEGARPPPMGQEQRNTAAQHLGRVIPIQIQRQVDNAQQQNQQIQQQQHQQLQNQQHQHQQQQRWGTNLPVQVELGRHPVGPPPPQIRRTVAPVAYNNPMGLYSNQNAMDSYQQQAGELAAGVNNMSVGGGESPRMEPIQSKSMRLIQKVAENELKRYEEEQSELWGRRSESMEQDDRHLLNLFKSQVDEGSSLHNTTEPRFMGGHIPSKAFRALQTTLPPPSPQAQQIPLNCPQSPVGPVTHNIQIRMSPQQQNNLPPSEQTAPEPKKYMGSNIPSRSFKILQAMTAEDDPSALDSEASSPHPADKNNPYINQSPSSISLSSSEGTLSSDLWASNSSSGDPNDPNDPYSYMSWYYWWYYVSYYWAGYDMTGYEYPEGWDPNCPYFPPEFYTEYNNDPNIYNSNNLENCVPDDEPKVVPKIVIDDTVNVKEGLNNLNDCDSVRESDEESYWSCAEESEKVIETKDKISVRNADKQPEDNQEETEEDEEEECEETDEILLGIVEEPDTQTSEDSDATLVDENNSSRSLLIEEYNSSESEQECIAKINKNKLSTIDELTEKSRASSTNNSNDWSEWDWPETKEVEEQPKIMTNGHDFKTELIESEEDSESTEEELSSVSVIENKSDGTRGTESKREDSTDTSSSSSDEDDTDNDLDTAVTVRLPIKLSFGKTKSYKDITTLLVCDSEIKSDDSEEAIIATSPPKKEVTFDIQEKVDQEEVINQDEEEEEEPVVSYTISLSRQPSREEDVKVEEEPDIDFWGQITCSSSGNKSLENNSWIDTEDYKEDDGRVEKKFNFWDKSVKTIETRRFSNFEISEDYESDTGGVPNDNINKSRVKRYTHTQKRHSVPGLPFSHRCSIASENQKLTTPEESVRPKSEIAEVSNNFSSGWSFWDDLENKSPESLKDTLAEEKVQKDTEEVVDEEEDYEENDVEEILAEEKVPEVQEEEDYEVEVCVEIKLPSPRATSNSEISIDSKSDYEEEDEENESEEEEEDANDPEVMTNEPEAPSISEVALPPPVPVSDETSDESSKSSGTTTIEKPEEKSLTKEICEERSIKIRELGEQIKLIENDDEEKCTCHLGNRMARAESLLWRIERFLHESLSLGSEDDSGVMTDLSRQISDVDTDVDNDQNDTEFLLTAAAAAKDRRANHHNHQGACNSNKAKTISKESPISPDVVRRRPQSEIIVETSSKFGEEIQEEEGVKMRTTSAERKALRYQRAKTHSRLFQLLQDECGKEEDDEEEEEEQNEPKYEVRESVTTTTTEIEQSTISSRMTPINVDTTERRSRLLPLPFKNILISSCGGGGMDSNSSPSGSSGVLSPTSPVTRDQLLADIINEFHLRHQDSQVVLQNRRRFSRFPSKIFKILQEEFGEEFYQTFECDDLPLNNGGGSLLMSLPNNHNSTATTAKTSCAPTASADVHECTIHKSESLKAMEEARDDSKQSTPDFLEVPISRKRNFTRDFRNPKSKTS